DSERVGVTLSGYAQTLAGRFCILATGCRNLPALPQRPSDDCAPRDAVAIRGYFKSSSNCRQLLISMEPEAAPGYGWVFPVGDGMCNAGLLRILDHGSANGLRGAHERFLRE